MEAAILAQAALTPTKSVELAVRTAPSTTHQKGWEVVFRSGRGGGVGSFSGSPGHSVQPWESRRGVLSCFVVKRLQPHT